MSNKLTENVRATMARVFNVSPNTIDEKTSIDSIAGWDSMSHLMLLAALENENNIKFSFEETLEMINYDAIVTIMQKKLL